MRRRRAERARDASICRRESSWIVGGRQLSISGSSSGALYRPILRPIRGHHRVRRGCPRERQWRGRLPRRGDVSSAWNPDVAVSTVTTKPVCRRATTNSTMTRSPMRSPLLGNGGIAGACERSGAVRDSPEGCPRRRCGRVWSRGKRKARSTSASRSSADTWSPGPVQPTRSDCGRCVASLLQCPNQREQCPNQRERRSGW